METLGPETCSQVLHQVLARASWWSRSCARALGEIVVTQRECVHRVDWDLGTRTAGSPRRFRFATTKRRCCVGRVAETQRSDRRIMDPRCPRHPAKARGDVREKTERAVRVSADLRVRRVLRVVSRVRYVACSASGSCGLAAARSFTSVFTVPGRTCGDFEVR